MKDKEHSKISNFFLENLRVQAHTYKADGCPEEDLSLNNVIVEAVDPEAWMKTEVEA